MNDELARTIQVVVATLAVALIASIALWTSDPSSTVYIVGGAFGLIGGMLGVHYTLDRRVRNGG